MYLQQYLPFLFSNLFRFSSYIFLQIIPTRLARPALPTSYILYILTTWLCPPHVPHRKTDKKIQNGSAHTKEPSSRRPSPLTVIALSLPTQSRALTCTNVLINTLLLLCAADFAFTPFFDAAYDVTFTRVGAVYPDSVKILARYPDANHTVQILYRETAALTPHNYHDIRTWNEGPQLNLTQRADWVDTVRLANLWPSTTYEYVLATSNKTILPNPSAPIPFRTFPDPRLQSANRFRFIATSCITPNFPYKGPFSKRNIAGFDLLADYLQLNDKSPPPQVISTDIDSQDIHNDTVTETLNATSAAPNTTAVADHAPTDFLLFLGDFIYADVPVYIGDDRDAYQRLYRRNYQSPSFRKVYERLPIFHAYDDHEFINNYAGKSQDAPPFINATGAYDIYAGNPNYDPAQAGQNFYDFRHGDVAFFVMDTRRYRSGPTQGDVYRTMLGDAQLTALYDWLHNVNETCTFKFIVSSVPFTSLWTHDAQVDSWAGYPEEKAALLAAFQSVPNVIVISGDRHEFAALEFGSPDPKAHLVREISTSPMNMFYIPFIHTLQPRSNASFARNVTRISEDGSTETVDEEEVPYEKVVAYIPVGNSKWSTFEIDTRDAGKPTLRIETVIDGKPAYHLDIVGVPVKAHHHGLGSIVSTNVKDLFDRIGLRPSKWF